MTARQAARQSSHLERRKDEANLKDFELAVTRMNGATIPRHRLLGVYYTPSDVAEVIARWALGGELGNVLDPSFGGCAFMQAAATVLETNSQRRAGHYVFGIDIDPACAKYVRESPSLREDNCVFGDFLGLQPSGVPGAPFQAIVGNPPYVRHHWLKDERRIVARRIAEESGQRLPETASLWAYFVLHALTFLRPKARMGMLVPEALLQAEYAAPVRAALKQHFRRVRLIHVRQRLFEGTDEPVVVIAGEDFGTPGNLEVLSVETTEELDAALKGIVQLHCGETLPNGRRITPKALAALHKAESSLCVVRFGDLATTRIGIVTGDNNHFIRSAAELKELGIHANARKRILSKTKWLSGLEFTLDDHKTAEAPGARAFLVRPTPALQSAPGIKRWISEGRRAEVHKHHKCEVRDPWFRVALGPKPDAFVTSTRLGPPRLVINRDKTIRCTNALYATKWKPDCKTAPETIALGFSTTLVALWAEVTGRRYGGGVLKLDLAALSKLPVPIVSTSTEIFKQVDSVMRRGDEARARTLADRAILRNGLGISASDLDAMREALAELIRQRVVEDEDF